MKQSLTTAVRRLAKLGVATKVMLATGVLAAASAGAVGAAHTRNHPKSPQHAPAAVVTHDSTVGVTHHVSVKHPRKVVPAAPKKAVATDVPASDPATDDDQGQDSSGDDETTDTSTDGDDTSTDSPDGDDTSTDTPDGDDASTDAPEQDDPTDDSSDTAEQPDPADGSDDGSGDGSGD